MDEKIAAIGKVTLNSDAAIKDARKAYNALSKEAAAKVENLSALEEAEKTLSGLKDKAEEAKKPEVKPETKPVVKVEKETAEVTPEIVKEAAKTGLVVELKNNMKVEYSKEAMAEIVKQMPADVVGLEVKLTEVKADADLNKSQQEAVQKAGDATVFSLTLDVIKSDGTVQNIHNFNGGKSTITVDYTLKDSTKTVEVYRVEENGTMKLMNTTFKDGKLSWVTDGHSFYAAVEVAKTAASGSSAAKNGAPKTGDTENMAMWAMILLGALAATPVLRRRVNK